MKKVFGIAALLLALAACNKIESENGPVDNIVGIPFSATVSLGDNAATKALAESGSTIVATWAEGEKVALIHNGVSDEMTVSSVSGGVATITGTITSPSDGEDVTIIYPSSAADGTTGNIKSDLLYAQNGLLTGTGTGTITSPPDGDDVTLVDISSAADGTTGNIKSDLLYAQNGLLTRTGSISENYDARKGSGKLKVDGTATLDGSVSLTNQFAIFKFTVRGADGTTVISAKPLTITIGTQDYVITPAAATDVLYAALPAVSGEKVSFDATDGSDRTYTCAKLSVSFAAGSYYQSTLKMREYVDLGIVVGGKKIKWATCNVGATNPEDYGDYFAWGATVPFYADGHSQDNPCYDWITVKPGGYDWISGNTGYDWASYPFVRDESESDYITKYTFADGLTDGIWYDEEGNFIGDNKTVLEFEDDAARANWGGSWRMPTHAEMKELVALSEGEGWETYKGVNGYRFTGSNGKTLFLPAAGYRRGIGLDYAGSSGRYWSSSLYEGDSASAWNVRFDSEAAGSSGAAHSYSCGRYFGQSVRPVTE